MPLEVSVNLASTHILKIGIAIQHETLCDKINEFCNLDSIVIPQFETNKKTEKKLDFNKRLFVDYDNIIEN